MITARQVAMEVLRQSREREGFTTDLIDAAFGRPLVAPKGQPPLKWTPQDRRFVTQLVNGVTRRRATLDALLAPLVQRSLDNVEAPLIDILRLGAFQLVFLTKVARHAAVHESVELADFVHRGQAKGFLNGVLRKLADQVTDDFGDYARADTVPLELASRKDALASGPGGPGRGPGVQPGAPRFRRVAGPVFPDPQRDPVEYLTLAFSWPRWLAARWVARHGPAECFRLGFWFNTPPGVTLRVNALATNRALYQQQLTARGIESDAGADPQALTLREGAAVRELPGYAEGAFAVQDPTSMAVARALAPRPDWRVLDLCAAPGGKTTHLAELMQNQGEIVACDTVAERLTTVRTLAKRLRIQTIRPYLITDADPPPPGPFDAVLVDAPCSNTGVLGRRPEVRWRLQPQELPHLVRLQEQLVHAALDRVRPGGVVVYSTCSIEPEENRGIVDRVRTQRPGVILESDAIAIPGLPSDGGYWCRLRKA